MTTKASPAHPGPVRRRGLRLAVASAILVVSLGGAFVAVHASYRAEAAGDALAASYRGVETCIYGGPLPDGESGALRLRFVEVCDDPRLSARSSGCADELSAMEASWAALDPADDDAPHARARAATREARAAAPRSLYHREAAWVELTAAFRALELPLPPGKAPPYCIQVDPELDYRDEAALIPAKYTVENDWWNMYVDARPNSVLHQPQEETVLGADLRGHWRTRAGPMACWLGGGAEAIARCGTAQSVLYFYDAAEGFQDVIIAGWRGDAQGRMKKMKFGGVLAGAETIDSLRHVQRGLWMHRPGVVTILDHAGRLQHFVGGKLRETIDLPAAADVDWTDVVHGWVLGFPRPARTDPAAPAAELRLMAVALKDDGHPAGPPHDLGALGGWSALRGCRQSDGASIVVIIGGSDCLSAERCPTNLAVTRLERGEPPLPVVRASFELPVRRMGDSWSDDLGCSPSGELRWVLERGAALEELVCGGDGCRLDRVEAPPAIELASMRDLIPIGRDQVLLVDTPSLAPHGAEAVTEPLRVRIGRLKELATVRSRIVLNVPREGATVPSIYGNLRVHSRGDVGWVTGIVRERLFAVRLRGTERAELVQTR
jgi:hypothetical protein